MSLQELLYTASNWWVLRDSQASGLLDSLRANNISPQPARKSAQDAWKNVSWGSQMFSRSPLYTATAKRNIAFGIFETEMLRYNTASRPAGRRTQPDHEDEAQRLLEHIQEGNVGIDEMLEGATKEGRRFEVNATEEFVDHITAFNLGQEHADTVERKAATKIATHGVGEGDSDLASHDMICQSLLNLHEHLQKLQKKEGKDCNVKHHVMLRMTGFNDLSAAETIKTIPFEILVSPCQPVARRGRTAAWQAATVKFDDKAGSAWQESICGLNNLGYLNGHIPNLVFNRNQLSLSHIQLSQGSLPPLNDEHISLRNLLGRKHDSTETGNNLMAFSKQDRGLLTLNLARSLFYLFDGPWSWGTQRCTADEFIFLGKVRSPRIFLHGCHKPYIHSNLSNPWKLRCQKAEDKRRSDRPSYQMFFGLAQILMEIHLGHSLDLDDSRPGGFRASLKEIAQNELKDPENSAYKEAILGCLDLSFNLLSVDDDQLSTKEKQLIHDNVIANLKENCKLWDFSRPEDIEFDTKLRDVPEKKPSGYNTPGAPGGAADAKSLAFGKDVEDSRIRRLPPGLSVFKLYDDTDHSSQSTKDAAREFLELIKIINEQYVKPCEEIETPRRKVRIAILDSGVSRKDTLIKGAFQAGIIQGVWGPGGTDRKDYDDTYGHGTHVARLLLETAPLAELYIAKVCDDKFLDENKLDNIVRAFEWALDDAIDVDIISISFGMQRNIPEIEAVVEKALERKKLVFAAAANDGGLNPRAFPACLPGVICVHACDGLGNRAPFSPWPMVRTDNFHTIGVSIESYWDDQTAKDGTVFKSGTSFATPVAAGIAANILEFAAAHLTRPHDNPKSLYEYASMRELLRGISKEFGTPETHFIKPWNLFTPIDFKDKYEPQSSWNRVSEELRGFLRNRNCPCAWSR